MTKQNREKNLQKKIFRKRWSNETRIQFLERIYGKDYDTLSEKSLSKYLIKAGYPSLNKLLQLE